MKLPLPRTTPAARRRAAAVVEFASVSMVFFGMLLALVEFGRGLMTDYVLVNAARRACRAGVVPNVKSDAIVKAAEEALARGAVRGATVTVKVNGTVGEAAKAAAGDRITVAVSVPVSSVSWIPGTRYLKGSLRGEYTLKRE
jgi:Flp pilus assembly protein TadG